MQEKKNLLTKGKGDCRRMTKRRAMYSRFKAWLSENGIRQSELAELLGKDRATVNLNLNGGRGDFSMEDVRKICVHYGISADEFFIVPSVSSKTIHVARDYKKSSNTK